MLINIKRKNNILMREINYGRRENIKACAQEKKCAECLLYSLYLYCCIRQKNNILAREINYGAGAGKHKSSYVRKYAKCLAILVMFIY